MKKELTHREVSSRGGKNAAKKLTKEQRIARAKKAGLSQKASQLKRGKELSIGIPSQPN